MLEMLLNVKVSIHRIFRTDLTVLICLMMFSNIPIFFDNIWIIRLHLDSNMLKFILEFGIFLAIYAKSP